MTFILVVFAAVVTLTCILLYAVFVNWLRIICSFSSLSSFSLPVISSSLSCKRGISVFSLWFSKLSLKVHNRVSRALLALIKTLRPLEFKEFSVKVAIELVSFS